MLNRLSINLKILLCPILFGLALLVIGITVSLGLAEQQRVSQSLTDQNLPAVIASDELLQGIADVQSDMLSIVVWKRLGRGDEDIAKIRSAIDNRLTRIAELSKTVSGKTAASDQERAALSSLVSEVDGYIASAKAAADMAQRNPALATPLITTAAAKYDTLRAQLDLIQKSTVRTALAEGQRARDLADQLRLVLILVSVISVSAALAASLGVGRHLSHGINRIASGMSRLAEGNLAIKIDGEQRRDEIGHMARALTVFRDNASAVEQLRQQQAKLEAEAKEEQRRVVEQLAAQIERAVDQLVADLARVSTDMTSRAEQMVRKVGEADEESKRVAAVSMETSQRISSIAAAIEELTRSISQVGQQSDSSLVIAKEAVQEAEKTDTTITGLSEAAQRINDVVGIISEIAEQTNLLALNATIEAARAGDAGKGFAVVASEVKNLANQTAGATGEIGQQISSVQRAVGEAVETIRGISDTIGKISDMADVISSSVAEQTGVTREIAGNVVQIEQGATAVANNTAEVNRTVQNLGSEAQVVLDTARQVLQRTQGLKQEIATLVGELRTRG